MENTVVAAEVVRRAASALLSAAATRTPCPPIRTLFDEGDIQSAYEVQSAVIATRSTAGRRRVGRKIGLTSAAVQSQVGVTQPDFGVLLDDMAVPDGSDVDMDRLLQPRVEAEVAFRLQSDLDDDINDETVRAAVGGAYAALEIVDSRVHGWDIGIVDTVADNASSGLYVLSDTEVPLEWFIPADVAMTMSVNGTTESTGTGRDCLGDPVNALGWLARTVARLGDPLRAGEIILSGALGPLVTVQPGDHVAAHISGLGPVSVTFQKAVL